MQFKQITVVGLGLIGGSFALCARKNGLADLITGWDHPEVLAEACTSGVIDAVEDTFEHGEVSDADLIYLAAPVGQIETFLKGCERSLKPGAIVTDAGSTKRDICRIARQSLGKDVAFVGGHPMAGSHNSGLQHATADLFNGASYAVVSDEAAGAQGDLQSDAVRVVVEIVQRLGAHPVLMTADQHDRAVARISHAPQLLSTALALAVAWAGEEEAFEVAGSGFLEMTRLAQSHWSVWEDICKSNADEITASLDEVLGEIEAIKKAVQLGDLNTLHDMFDAANDVIRRFHEEKEVKTGAARG
ncbi:MAG TPA: prephenate dehydrogenase/arogenate dehydrogenase family protein [Blastocatellia bacterium]|nr:prephenate dehydrogenase/arogenate dehydrogenase family protein [Blastocatellia bacterium]